jgi:hypothetical protein
MHEQQFIEKTGKFVSKSLNKRRYSNINFENVDANFYRNNCQNNRI